MREPMTHKQALEMRQRFFVSVVLVAVVVMLAVSLAVMLVSTARQTAELDRRLDEAELETFRLYARELAMTEAPVREPSRRAFLRAIFFLHNVTSSVETEDYGKWPVEGFYLEPLPCYGIRTLYAGDD